MTTRRSRSVCARAVRGPRRLEADPGRSRHHHRRSRPAGTRTTSATPTSPTAHGSRSAPSIPTRSPIVLSDAGGHTGAGPTAPGSPCGSTRPAAVDPARLGRARRRRRPEFARRPRARVDRLREVMRPSRSTFETPAASSWRAPSCGTAEAATRAPGAARRSSGQSLLARRGFACSATCGCRAVDAFPQSTTRVRRDAAARPGAADEPLRGARHAARSSRSRAAATTTTPAGTIATRRSRRRRRPPRHVRAEQRRRRCHPAAVRRPGCDDHPDDETRLMVEDADALLDSIHEGLAQHTAEDLAGYSGTVSVDPHDRRRSRRRRLHAPARRPARSSVCGRAQPSGSTGDGW